MEIDHVHDGTAGQFCEILCSFLQRCLFWVLSIGPIPCHIAFIMDGNRRYEKTHNLEPGMGHRAGYISLMSLLRYCYQLGVRYVTVYAFSIDNFKRQPDEVQNLMELLQEKIESLLKAESIVHQYGIRVIFIGNLRLLDDSVRAAAEKAMLATARNNQAVLSICIAYTSTDEMAHAMEIACKNMGIEIESTDSDITDCDDVELYHEMLDPPTVDLVDTELESMDSDVKDSNGGKLGHETIKPPSANFVDLELQSMDSDVTNCNGVILDHQTVEHPIVNFMDLELQSMDSDVTNCNGVMLSHETLEPPTVNLVDIEKNMYMAGAPDPDIVIRSSGETRLSNFLLWQTANSLLYSPEALWPEVGLKHFVWAVLNFQRNYCYLQKKRKQF